MSLFRLKGLSLGEAFYALAKKKRSKRLRSEERLADVERAAEEERQQLQEQLVWEAQMVGMGWDFLIIVDQIFEVSLS